MINFRAFRRFCAKLHEILCARKFIRVTYSLTSMYKIISMSSGKMSDERTTYGGTGIFFAVDIGLLIQTVYNEDILRLGNLYYRWVWGGVGWVGGGVRACVCDVELFSFF